MTLIDKDAVVAEIERLKDEYLRHSRNKFCAEWSCGTLDNILSFLDTLEVKKVDLEKEIANQYESNYEEYLTYEEFADIAKHFFELGLKASCSVGLTPDIDTLFEEEGIDTYSKEAKVFKEAFYKAIDNYLSKAQKGEEA